MIRPAAILAAILSVSCFRAARQLTPVIDAVHTGHALGHEQDGVNAAAESEAAM